MFFENLRLNPIASPCKAPIKLYDLETDTCFHTEAIIDTRSIHTGGYRCDKEEEEEDDDKEEEEEEDSFGHIEQDEDMDFIDEHRESALHLYNQFHGRPVQGESSPAAPRQLPFGMGGPSPFKRSGVDCPPWMVDTLQVLPFESPIRFRSTKVMDFSPSPIRVSRGSELTASPIHPASLSHISQLSAVTPLRKERETSHPSINFSPFLDVPQITPAGNRSPRTFCVSNRRGAEGISGELAFPDMSPIIFRSGPVGGIDDEEHGDDAEEEEEEEEEVEEIEEEEGVESNKRVFASGATFLPAVAEEPESVLELCLDSCDYEVGEGGAYSMETRGHLDGIDESKRTAGSSSGNMFNGASATMPEKASFGGTSWMSPTHQSNLSVPLHASSARAELPTRKPFHSRSKSTSAVHPRLGGGKSITPSILSPIEFPPSARRGRRGASVVKRQLMFQTENHQPNPDPLLHLSDVCSSASTDNRSDSMRDLGSCSTLGDASHSILSFSSPQQWASERPEANIEPIVL